MEGDILGNRVIIGGRFDGMIRAKGRVEIQPNAIVTGEIHTPCLVIEPGAIFDGQCHMLASRPKLAKPVTIPIRSAAGQSQPLEISAPKSVRTGFVISDGPMSYAKRRLLTRHAQEYRLPGSIKIDRVVTLGSVHLLTVPIRRRLA